MVDIFVLIMSMIGFWVSITSPESSALPKDLHSLDLVVVPVWGLYANLLAQLISQISSHVIIYYHHKIVQETLYTLMYNVVDQSCKKDSPQVMNKTCKETFIDENLNIEGGEIEVSETFNDENLNSEEGEIEVSLFESGGFPERLKDHSFSLNGTEKDQYVRVCKQINILFA